MIDVRAAFAAPLLAIAMAAATCAVSNASPDVVGKTFDEANSILRSAGYAAVVVTTLGGRTDRSDCIVTQQGSRQSSNGQEALLALNCNAPLAGPGVPGNSAGSPAGRAAAAAVVRVSKANVEQSLVSQLATSPGPAWAQCSGDLVGTIDSSIDCTVLANHEKQTYTLTVSGVEDGRISYNIAPKA
ncbi:PASTA domain-containing protein [Mycolicibacterium sphagni]|uniref:PASTA domain-containing protein n=1 Tax=Mycolicibacterium sphagni TaxID=1786 RepID=UPI001A9C65E2|nr:PASTA domain-containing protein [Mycolicibacterium sphagni]MCV7179508.1 PASTA domain-containing protein [Mycolicibacterium sphagni]